MTIKRLDNITLAFGGGICSFTGSIVRETYQESGAPALEMIDPEGESIGVLSVNLGAMPENQTAIKDYSENEGILAQLVAQNIVRDTGRRIPSGFISAPVVEIIAPQLRA